MTQALLFLVRAIADLFVIFVLLRLVLQYLRADFRNPLAQAVLQITSPLILPARKLLPPIGKIDTATIAVALIVEFAFLLFLNWIVYDSSYGPVSLILYSALRSVVLLVRLLIFAVLAYVILSWISPGPNPATAIVHTVAEPVVRPIRRFLPPFGGIDFSPMVAILLLMALNIVLVGWLPAVFG